MDRKQCNHESKEIANTLLSNIAQYINDSNWSDNAKAEALVAYEKIKDQIYDMPESDPIWYIQYTIFLLSNYLNSLEKIHHKMNGCW